MSAGSRFQGQEWKVVKVEEKKRCTQVASARRCRVIQPQRRPCCRARIHRTTSEALRMRADQREARGGRSAAREGETSVDLADTAKCRGLSARCHPWGASPARHVLHDHFITAAQAQEAQRAAAAQKRVEALATTCTGFFSSSLHNLFFWGSIFTRSSQSRPSTLTQRCVVQCRRALCVGLSWEDMG